MIAIPNNRLQAAMTRLMANELGGLIFKLFQNNITPDNTTVVTDFTEANFDGYAAQTCAGWSFTGIVSGEAVFTAADVNFDDTGAVTPNVVYGYYVVDGGGVLQFSDRSTFALGVTMNANGLRYTVSPRIGLKAQ